MFYTDKLSFFEGIIGLVWFTFSQQNVRRRAPCIHVYAKIQFGHHLQKQHRNLKRILREFSWQIINPTSSLIP